MTHVQSFESVQVSFDTRLDRTDDRINVWYAMDLVCDGFGRFVFSARKTKNIFLANHGGESRTNFCCKLYTEYSFNILHPGWLKFFLQCFYLDQLGWSIFDEFLL